MDKTALTNDRCARSPVSVVVAVCDQDFAQVIADFVEEHNWPEGSHFHVFYVVEDPSIRRVLRFSPDIAQQIIDENDLYGNNLVKEVKERLKKAFPKNTIEASVGRGVAKEEILNKAVHVRANYIVLGSHGRLGVGAMLLGSVSLAVMMEAGCSVLIVRHPLAQSQSRTGVPTSIDDLPQQMVSYWGR